MKAPTLMCLGACLASTIAAVPLQVRELTEDDVILYNAQGRMEIISKADFAPLNEPLPPSLVGVDKRSIRAPPSDLVKRDSSTIIIEDPPMDFLNWDIQMSSVLEMKENNGTVTLTSGYMAANAVTTSWGGELNIMDFLSVTYKKDYTQTWTSVGNTAYTFPVPAGKFGAVVSNPWTHRESGHIFNGRIGSEGTWDAYQGDSNRNKTYGEGLNWVDGVITVCLGTQYPMPCCRGDCTMT